jgi:uncharacterized protein YkwD
VGEALAEPLSRAALRAGAIARRLAAAAIGVAAAGPGLARADAAADLVGLINEYRAAPPSCAGRRMSRVPPLAPSPLLVQVTPASPGELGAALRAIGYSSAAATTLRVSGLADAPAALRFVFERHCAELLDARYSQIGVVRLPGNVWRITLAQPLLPADLGDWEHAGRKILERVNIARAQPRQCGAGRFAAAAPLVWSEALALAALVHSRDMVGRDYFEHHDLEGRSVGYRVTAAGYPWRAVGENIAAGLGEPAAVVDGWLASPGHCANIMSPDFTEMGAAFAVGAGTVRGIWWTQVFGRR